MGAEEHSRKRSGKALKRTRLEAGVRSRAGKRKRRGPGAQTREVAAEEERRADLL